MGVGAEDGAHPAVEIAGKRLFFGGRLGVKVDHLEPGAIPREQPVGDLKRAVDRLEKGHPRQVEHRHRVPAEVEGHPPGRRIEEGQVGRAEQRLGLLVEALCAAAQRVVAGGHRVRPVGEDLLGDRPVDPDPVGVGVLPVDDADVRPEPAAQRRQPAAEKIEPRLPDDIPHTE